MPKFWGSGSSLSKMKRSKGLVFKVLAASPASHRRARRPFACIHKLLVYEDFVYM
jgi:hypothetical protein